MTTEHSDFGAPGSTMRGRFRCVLRLALILWTASASGAVGEEPKRVPRMQAVPQPNGEVSFQREGVELARYHFGAATLRPFIFPVNGPSGRSLTRLGHPRDPQTHSHHQSVWVSHQNVNGSNFWEDGRGPRIVHQRLLRLDDGDDSALVEAENAWIDRDGRPLLRELRRTTVRALEGGEWLLVIDLQLEARDADVVLGETAFGLLGVRMARSIGVNDGGGTIRNSEGGVDEAGCFRKPARWCDYSGPITATAREGITLMDHPANPHHPVPFHVRNDGWMGAALTLPGALTIRPGEPLRLRYALYVHAGVPPAEALQRRWEEFAVTSFAEFLKK